MNLDQIPPATPPESSRSFAEMQTEIERILGNAWQKKDITALVEANASQVLKEMLHNYPEQARGFLETQLDFTCTEPQDFMLKAKFIDVIGLYFSSKLWIDGLDTKSSAHNLAVAKASNDPVLEIFMENVKNQHGSALLHLYAQEMAERFNLLPASAHQLTKQDKLPYQPIVLAPKIYAFDTEKSFWMLHKHTDPADPAKTPGLYVTHPDDFAAVTAILEQYPNYLDIVKMSTDEYHTLAGYFTPLVTQTAQIDPTRPNRAIDRSWYEGAEFRKLNTPEFRGHIEQSLRIPLQALPIPVQFQLLSYLKDLDYADIGAIRTLAEDFGPNGLIPFLGLDATNPEFAKTILALTNLSRPQATAILKEFRAIADTLLELKEFIAEEFPDHPTSPHMITTTKHKLLATAKSFLSAATQGTDATPQLQSLNQDLRIYFTVAKEMYREHRDNFGFEDFAAVQLQSVTLDHIPAEKREAIAAFYLADRQKSQAAGPLTQQIYDDIQSGNPSMTIHLCEKGDQILSMVITQDYTPKTGPTGILVSGLTVHPSSKPTNFPRSFVLHIANNVLRDDYLYLHVDTMNTGAQTLYQQLGFKEQPALAVNDTVMTMSRPPLGQPDPSADETTHDDALQSGRPR